MSNVSPGPNLRGAVDLSSLVRRANAPAPAEGSAPAGTDGRLVFEAGDATFQQIVDLSARVPVVVEFYAPGLEPALARVVTSYGGRLALATIDGSANPQLAQAFQVRRTILPVVALAAGGFGQQAGLFVEADGLGGTTGGAGQFADLHAASSCRRRSRAGRIHSLPGALDLVVTTRCVLPS